MANKVGYLVIHLRDLRDISVYTYKKGVMDKMGATRNDMDTLVIWRIIGDYLLIRVDVKGFNRRGRKG